VSFQNGQDSEYNTWRVAAEVGYRSTFKELGDFFVNLPSLQDELPGKEAVAGCEWTIIEPVTLASLFAYRMELLGLLRTNAGPVSLP
jgi:hypothetical protein